MSWRNILKEWEPKRLKATPKQIDVILEYLKRNPQGSTINGIIGDLDLHMKRSRLTRMLNEHPNVTSKYEYVGYHTEGTRRKLYFHI